MPDILNELDLDKMEILVGIELEKNIKRFINDLEAAINRMQVNGMPEDEIKAVLIGDLTNGGRIFGQLKNGIKNSISSAINIASNEAAIKVFTNAGVKRFRWITVSSNPCPDCVPRHGRVETMDYWRTVGLPGSGFSVCQNNCKCRLVPESYKGKDLDNPIIRKKGKR